MSGTGVIEEYVAVLAAHLPGQVVAELADGLDETFRHYLRQGLDADAAARAAVAEFGKPGVVIAGFVQVNPARRAARRLLVIGPGLGVCWACFLLTSRAWAWPVPVPARAAAVSRC